MIHRGCGFRWVLLLITVFWTEVEIRFIKFQPDFCKDAVLVRNTHLLAILFREILNTVLDNLVLSGECAECDVEALHVVITIPLNAEIQQHALYKAASLAGFSRVAFLADVISSCLSYRASFSPWLVGRRGVASPVDRLLFVDIGYSGATAAMVSYGLQNIIVHHEKYNDSGGGKTVNLALAHYFAKKIQDTHKITALTEMAPLRDSLLQECSRVKERLLYEKEVWLSLQTNDGEFRMRVSMDDVQTITSHVLQGILRLIEDVLKRTNLSHNDITTVVVSGASSSLYKSSIMGKFTKAICRSSDVFWKAKGSLRSFSSIQLDVSNSDSWVGKYLQDFSVVWKKMDTEEDDSSYITSGVKTVSITPEVFSNHPRALANSISTHLVESPTTAHPNAQTDSIDHLDQSITQSTTVLAKLEEDDPSKPDAYNALCGLYLEKYGLTGDVFALNNATISAIKALGNIDYRSSKANPAFLSNLSSCLVRQYERSKDIEVLNKAILYQSYVIKAIRDATRENAGYFINYGVFLRVRGETLGDTDDIVASAQSIQRAIGALVDGIDTNPSYIPDLITALGSLGSALQRLYQWTGSLDDLYRSIQCYENALYLTPEKDPSRSFSLNQYGSAIMLHYKHFGDIRDVKKAIVYFTEALENISENHPSRPLYLSNYANALQALYRDSKDLDTVNHAIELQQKALRLIGETHLGRAKHHNNLGNLFFDKFEITNEIEDLDKGAENQQLAVNLIQEDNVTEKFVYLCSLANSFRIRFSHSYALEHLGECIKIMEDALDYIGEGAERSKAISHLADTYLERYMIERDEIHRQKCLELCKTAVTSSASLKTRFYAARTWTTATSYSRNGPDALEATTAMVDLLSQLAWPGLSLSSQIDVLQFGGQAACNAAAVALHYKDIRRALEWLEQGRTIVWNQLLRIRSPLDDLKKREPELAEEIFKLSRQLEVGAEDRHETISSPREISGKDTRAQIALKRDKLLKKARAIPGFERLMMTKEYENFAVASYDGSAVVINVSMHRCDAIILAAGDVPFLLPLESFSLQQAEDLKAMMIQVLQESASLQRHSGENEDSEVQERFGKGRRRRPSRENIDTTLRYILKELYTKVVEPIIICLGIGIAVRNFGVTQDLLISMTPQFDEDLPHIWWCPTGPLTFLPLHAAGIYAAESDTETPRISILDYVVSSYIPSLSSLHNIMYKKSHHRPPFKMVTVIQPNTPGQAKLPATLSELKIIQSRCKSAGTFEDLKILVGSEATRETVMKGLREHSWVHLACHGKQDAKDATKSGLHLHDGTLFLEDIVKNQIPDADFAFLSACQTASGDTARPDEAVHLAAGLLMAGYTSVIASMWSIGDDDASMIADDVYGYLLQEGKVPESRQAARALHSAVRKLRIKHCGPHGGSNFLSWLPYIHVGM